MAIRVRKDGTMLCAAMHPPMPGDTYIDDALHYKMSVEHKVIGSEPMERHELSGQWWWTGGVPDGVQLADYYLENKYEQGS